MVKRIESVKVGLLLFGLAGLSCMLINGLSLAMDLLYCLWYRMSIHPLVLRPFLPSFIFKLDLPLNSPPAPIIDFLSILVSLAMLGLLLMIWRRLFGLNRFGTLCLTLVFGAGCVFRGIWDIAEFGWILVQPSSDSIILWTMYLAPTLIVLGSWIVLITLRKLIVLYRSKITTILIIAFAFLPWGAAIGASKWFWQGGSGEFTAMVQWIASLIFAGLVSWGCCFRHGKAASFDCIGNNLSWRSVIAIDVACVGMVLLFWAF